MKHDRTALGPRARSALVVLLASLPVAALASSAALRARAWTPLVRLTAGKGPDAPRVAAARIGEGLSTIHALLYGLSADDATRAFFATVLERLEAFDLEALYETLPEKGEGGWRGVRFRGRSESGKYEVRTAASGQPCACDPDGNLGSRFGDLAVAFRSRRAQDAGSENFVSSVHTGIGLGNVSWAQLLAAIGETIRLAESSAPGASRDGSPRPDAASLAAVKRDNPRLRRDDLELLALFREGFPHLYDHLCELYRVDDVLAFDPDDEPWKQLHFVVAVRPEAKQKLPALADWLEGLGPLIAGRVDFTDAKGRTVATFRFSTKDLTATFDAFIANGKLCPVENGKVLTEEGYDLEAVSGASRRDRWSFDFELNGIVTEVHDMSFKVDYARTQDGMETRVVLDEEPKVRVRGAAFGIVPTWAIDLVMPENMEDLTRSFFRVLAKGNDGHGLVLSLKEIGGKSGANVLDVDGQHESLNNFLVRLGFKVSRRKLIPPDDARAEIAAYLKRGHEAFSRDLAAFAADAK